MKKQALQLLAEEPHSLKELSSKMDLTDKRTYKILKSLFEKGQVTSFKGTDKHRRYRAVKADT
jgi:sugar-specific transcriptional regulator TrmB